MHLLRVALCIAVWADTDPLWTRSRYGLVRWNCGHELGDLCTINPGWVDLVERLNRMAKSRPAVWEVDGDR